MYTEEDLRVTLGALEHEAPDAVGVLAALARARRQRTVRRRLVGVVAAGAVAAAVAGGSVLVGDLAAPRGLDTAAPPATRHLDPFRYPFAVDESSGFQAVYRAARFAGGASAEIGLPGTDAGGQYPYWLEVLETGRYTPPAGQVAEPVRLNGMAGFYRPDFQYEYGEENTAGVPGVAWEYAPDAWAVLRYRPTEPELTPPADVRETLLRMAEAVRFDRTTPVRLPFRVGELPAGLHPAEDFPADMHAGPNHLSALVRLEGAAGWLHILLADMGEGDPGPGDVDVDADTDAVPDDVTFVKVNLGQFSLVVSGEGFSADEMRRIAVSITPADLYDADTWIDARTALPLR
jgi:hypothetical protein